MGPRGARPDRLDRRCGALGSRARSAHGARRHGCGALVEVGLDAREQLGKHRVGRVVARHPLRRLCPAPPALVGPRREREDRLGHGGDVQVGHHRAGLLVDQLRRAAAALEAEHG
jgi:hypothetical protein